MKRTAFRRRRSVRARTLPVRLAALLVTAFLPAWCGATVFEQSFEFDPSLGSGLGTQHYSSGLLPGWTAITVTDQDTVRILVDFPDETFLRWESDGTGGITPIFSFAPVAEAPIPDFTFTVLSFDYLGPTGNLPNLTRPFDFRCSLFSSLCQASLLIAEADRHDPFDGTFRGFDVTLGAAPGSGAGPVNLSAFRFALSAGSTGTASVTLGTFLVPEPAALGLVALGLAAVGSTRRRPRAA